MLRSLDLQNYYYIFEMIISMNHCFLLKFSALIIKTLFLTMELSSQYKFKSYPSTKTILILYTPIKEVKHLAIRHFVP